MITGITGQDGYYLTELLLSKGYEVTGLVRRTSTPNTARIEKFFTNPGLKIIEADLSDSSSLHRAISLVKPHEVYNLAAMSHVATSFFQPEYCADVNSIGTVRLLEALRSNNLEGFSKFYQASTSELYGKVQSIPQNEKTPFYPRSPYAVSKLYAYWAVVNYREAYGMYTSNGILFNHESPMRGLNFVTRKITSSVAKIKQNKMDVLKMGNLDAKRDWGYAKEYVEGMWMMLQQNVAEDFVLATGETHSVREFITLAFKAVDIEIEWVGKTGSLEEKAKCKKSGKVVVEISPELMRPAEVDLLIGDFTKAKTKLGWNPKTKFHELVSLMMDADMKLVAEGKL